MSVQKQTILKDFIIAKCDELRLEKIRGSFQMEKIKIFSKMPWLCEKDIYQHLEILPFTNKEM